MIILFFLHISDIDNLNYCVLFVTAYMCIYHNNIKNTVIFYEKNGKSNLMLRIRLTSILYIYIYIFFFM